MKELAITTPVTPSAMRNDGAGAGCVWNCDRVRNYEAETPALAPREEERSTVGGMTPRQ